MLTGLGRDGLPGGQGFDADSTVRVASAHRDDPYRGQYEHMRRVQDMSRIVRGMTDFYQQNGHGPTRSPSWSEGPIRMARTFTDFCGNLYDFINDTGGPAWYSRAFGCDGPGTDPLGGCCTLREQRRVRHLPGVASYLARTV